jgi:hypothetical protein
MFNLGHGRKKRNHTHEILPRRVSPVRAALGWSRKLDENAHNAETPCIMSAPAPDQSFLHYKIAEKKALEIVAAMKLASANKVDIELALLVAIFELHKQTVPAATIASVIQGHLKQLVPHYSQQAPASP